MTTEKGPAEQGSGRQDIGQLVGAINQAHANPNTQVTVLSAADRAALHAEAEKLRAKADRLERGA
jgi:hypothetical protein